MPDLVVGTSAQRVAAAGMRAVGGRRRICTRVGTVLRCSRRGWRTPKPTRAADEFLGAWSYGMGVIGHQVGEPTPAVDQL